jgi:hypothetical protein
MADSSNRYRQVRVCVRAFAHHACVCVPVFVFMCVHLCIMRVLVFVFMCVHLRTMRVLVFVFMCVHLRIMRVFVFLCSCACMCVLLAKRVDVQASKTSLSDNIPYYIRTFPRTHSLHSSAAAACHVAQMSALRAVRQWAPRVVEKVISTMLQHTQLAAGKSASSGVVVRLTPSVKSVGVQAGPASAVSTSSFGMTLSSPSTPRKGYASPQHQVVGAGTERGVAVPHKSPSHSVARPHVTQGGGGGYERKPTGGLQSGTATVGSASGGHGNTSARASSGGGVRRAQQRSTAHAFGLDVVSLAAAVQAPR